MAISAREVRYYTNEQSQLDRAAEMAILQVAQARHQDKYAFLIRLARRERDMCRKDGQNEAAEFCALRSKAYRIAAMMETLGIRLDRLWEYSLAQRANS
jgi:hypothetical protein